MKTIRKGGLTMEKRVSDSDIYFLREAISCAKRNPLHPYGALITLDEKEVIYTSVNESHHNPLLHGEMSVLNKLFSGTYSSVSRNRLALYTTAEPCPMCASAIYWANINKVVYGSSIPFLHNLFNRQITIRAKDIFDKTPSHYKIELIGSVLESECDELFMHSLTLKEDGRGAAT